MTAPKHYNGKPIPPGTWLAQAAEEARKLSDLPPSGLSPHDTVPVATYNRMVRKRDEAVAENLKIAEAYRFVVKQLADAPHARGCILEVPPKRRTRSDPWVCSCWKAGL